MSERNGVINFRKSYQLRKAEIRKSGNRRSLEAGRRLMEEEKAKEETEQRRDWKREEIGRSEADVSKRGNARQRAAEELVENAVKNT